MKEERGKLEAAMERKEKKKEKGQKKRNGKKKKKEGHRNGRCPLFMQWLHRKDSNMCSCEQGAVQIAAPILGCGKLGDGKSRTREQVEGDPDFCRQVFKFLHEQI